jgi:hypothetical protein
MLQLWSLWDEQNDIKWATRRSMGWERGPVDRPSTQATPRRVFSTLIVLFAWLFRRRTCFELKTTIYIPPLGHPRHIRRQRSKSKVAVGRSSEVGTAAGIAFGGLHPLWRPGTGTMRIPAIPLKSARYRFRDALLHNVCDESHTWCKRNYHDTNIQDPNHKKIKYVRVRIRYKLD